jgi:Domain of unknown function (DUF4234)
MTDWTIPGSATSKRGRGKSGTATADQAAEPSPAEATSAETPEAASSTDAAVPAIDTDTAGESPMVFVEAPTHDEGMPSAPPWSYSGKALPYRGIARTPAADKPAVLPVKSGVISPPSVPSLGLAGRRRSPAAVIILSVITLGIYAVMWHERINAEMGDFDTRMHVHPAKSTIPVMLVWLFGILVSIAGALRIVSAVLNIALPFDPGFTVAQAYFLLGGILAIPYLMLLFPFSLVAITMTLERVRILEDRVGRTTDVQLRPTVTVCWLLVPVIGGLILQAKVQRRLNRVWELAHTPILTGRLSRAS